MSDLKKLRAFAQDVMEFCPDDFNLDGMELQEIAVKHGLLKPEIRYKDCSVEGVLTCQCAEYYDLEEFELGIECYRHTELLTGKTDVN